VTQFIARQAVSYRDHRGHVGKTSFYYNYSNAAAANVLDAQAGVQDILTAILNMTNGLLVSVSGLASQVENPQQYGANAQFANAEDKARLWYTTSKVVGGVTDFAKASLLIPAPLVAIFYADQETVNPANALVAALTAALGTVDGAGGAPCDRRGYLFGAFIAGELLRRRFQRRITLWDKSANLDEPEE